MDLAIFLKGHRECLAIDCKISDGTKCERIGTSDVDPSFSIEDYCIYEKRNVCAIGVQPREKYGWDISFREHVEREAQSFYFCIDGIYHEAWAHWVEESAIYLPLYLKLKTHFPFLKLYSFGKRGYKDSMYNAFRIPQEDIVYTIEHENNLCLFPYYISLGDHRRPFQFFQSMKKFYTWIVEHCPPVEKDIDILYLPRGSKENCKQNDRHIPVQLQLLEIFSHYPEVKVLFTDTVDNMLDQWSLVRRAKLILLNEGSNLLLNGFFAEESKILVLGGDGNKAHLMNPSPALLYFDTLKRNNRYYHVPYEWTHGVVLSFLSEVMGGSRKPQFPPEFRCHLDCQHCRFQKIGVLYT